jgi:hypothetical protein
MRPIRGKEKIYCIVRDILDEYNCYYYQSRCYFYDEWNRKSIFHIKKELKVFENISLSFFFLIICSHNIPNFVHLFK